MREKFIQTYTLFLMLACAFAACAPPVYAQDGGKVDDLTEKRMEAFQSTGLPLPRFVSLGKDEVFVRAGPGQKYPIEWVYTRKDYPVEIILEFGNWRKVRDIEGDEGWVFHALLSGKRHAIVTGEGYISAYSRSAKGEKNYARRVARLEPFVIVALEECRPFWCKVKAGKYRGWVERKSLWGVYEDEFFD